MNIQDLIGGAAAAVIGPHDVVATSIDRYLTGAQLEVIGSYFQKKLPNNQVVLLQKGMTAEVSRAAGAIAA